MHQIQLTSMTTVLHLMLYVTLQSGIQYIIIDQEMYFMFMYSTQREIGCLESFQENKDMFCFYFLFYSD
jgi:hypothetical protein